MKKENLLQTLVLHAKLARLQWGACYKDNLESFTCIYGCSNDMTAKRISEVFSNILRVRQIPFITQWPAKNAVSFNLPTRNLIFHMMVTKQNSIIITYFKTLES